MKNVFLLLLVVLMVSGCNPNNSPKSAVQDPSHGSTALNSDSFNQDKKDLSQKFQNQIDKASAEIDKMKARSEEIKAESRDDWNAAMKTLEVKRDKAKDKLNQIKGTSKEAWNDFKGGVD